MFSPADLNAILRAIAQYNHCTRKLNEIDEEENEIVESVAGQSDVSAEETVDDINIGSSNLFREAVLNFKEANQLTTEGGNKMVKS